MGRTRHEITTAQANAIESLRQYCLAIERDRRTHALPRVIKEFEAARGPRGTVWVRAVTGYPKHTFDDLAFEWTVGPRGAVRVGRASLDHSDTEDPRGKARNLRAFYGLAAQQLQ